jgi:hypothetical protein
MQPGQAEPDPPGREERKAIVLLTARDPGLDCGLASLVDEF